MRRGFEVEKEAAKALESDEALAVLISYLETLERTWPLQFMLQNESAIRVILEKLSISPEDLLGIAKLVVHTEYLIARKLVWPDTDIEKIIRTLLLTMLHKAKERKLDAKHLERARTVVEAIFSGVAKHSK